METSFNPAAVGKLPVINITAAYAMDMAGYEHNPRTLYAAADMPFYVLKTYHGVGIQLMNDEIGLFTHQRLALQYALRFKLFGGNFAVGIQAGFLNESFDGSGVDAEEPNDPALATSQVEGNGFDMGMGLYYTHDPWYLGLSVQHLNAPLIELGTTNELKVDPTYYFTGGYNIRLRNPFLTIHPSVLLRTDGVVWRGDITGRLVYTNGKKMLYGGVGYSPDKMLQGRLFSYGDTQRYRLGINHAQIPVNAPIAPVSNTHRDGYMQMGSFGGMRNYNPSYYNDYTESNQASEPPLHIKEGEIMDRYNHREYEEDHFSQAGDLYRLMSAEQKEILCQNIKEAMEGVPVEIKKRQIEHFKKADTNYGKRVEELVL